jgi:hypothetical protein
VLGLGRLSGAVVRRSLDSKKNLMGLAGVAGLCISTWATPGVATVAGEVTLKGFLVIVPLVVVRVSAWVGGWVGRGWGGQVVRCRQTCSGACHC